MKIEWEISQLQSVTITILPVYHFTKLTIISFVTYHISSLIVDS